MILTNCRNLNCRGKISFRRSYIYFSKVLVFFLQTLSLSTFQDRQIFYSCFCNSTPPGSWYNNINSIINYFPVLRRRKCQITHSNFGNEGTGFQKCKKPKIVFRLWPLNAFVIYLQHLI